MLLCKLERIINEKLINDSIYLNRLHFTWLVNSYAHFFGNKPFDQFIKPTDSYTVALLAFGEGKRDNLMFLWLFNFFFHIKDGTIITTYFRMITRRVSMTSTGAISQPHSWNLWLISVRIY